MSTGYVKLHYDILDDYKTHQLSDGAFRLFILMLPLAGKRGDTGALPTFSEMAFELRRFSENEMRDYLNELIDSGLVTEWDDGYTVTNFEKRQAAISGRDRVANHRQKQREVAETLRISNEMLQQRYDERYSDDAIYNNNIYNNNIYNKESNDSGNDSLHDHFYDFEDRFCKKLRIHTPPTKRRKQTDHQLKTNVEKWMEPFIDIYGEVGCDLEKTWELFEKAVNTLISANYRVTTPFSCMNTIRQWLVKRDIKNGGEGGSGELVWVEILKLLRVHGQYGEWGLDEKTASAVRAVGGQSALCNMANGQVEKMKRAFIAAYEGDTDG